jgi:hypothetical protein
VFNHIYCIVRNKINRIEQKIMGLLNLMHDHRFNTFFSFVVGIGLICILRPMCSGSNCIINKPPSEADFDKHVYRMGGGKCYEFKTTIVECPVSGTIEAFKMKDQFSRRTTPIL